MHQLRILRPAFCVVWWSTGVKVLPCKENKTAVSSLDFWNQNVAAKRKLTTVLFRITISFHDVVSSVEALAQAEQDEVLAHWELVIGYYARARNMHKAAKMLVDGNFDSGVSNKVSKVCVRTRHWDARQRRLILFNFRRVFKPRF